jgi:TetR/AcrR family transcriptional regulator, lmrAB and yxaGH operons repressor
VPLSSTARQDAISSATRLFDRQGYHGTGLAQILTESGAPRGSFYFHFPGGKAQLGIEAVQAATEEVENLMRIIAHKHPEPAALVLALANTFSRRLQRAGYAEGCAVAAVTMSTADHTELRAACQDAYARWQTLLGHLFVVGGVDPRRATPLATLVIAALVIMCRAQCQVAPLDHIATELGNLLATDNLAQ